MKNATPASRLPQEISGHPTPVIVIGAGAHGRVVLDILCCAGVYRAAGFIDADPALAGTSIAGVPVLGPLNLLPKLLKQNIRHAIVAIGDNRTRRGYAEKLAAGGWECVNAIHPSAVVSETARLGKNVVIAAGALVGADAILHDFALINTGAIVEHECEIGAAAHVCPGAKLAGRVKIGDGAFVGLGAAVIQCREVGESAIVGAGAVVIADVPAGATVVGVPARVIKQAESGEPISLGLAASGKLD